MIFIDLFAGLGGFHKALHELGHVCVFVSELDPALREVYQENWGIEVHGDIKKVLEKDINTIPEHDILCAGFPCQPFSKAGNQLGREDDRGTLFDEIVKILEHRKPNYFILENVPFIANVGIFSPNLNISVKSGGFKLSVGFILSALPHAILCFPALKSNRLIKKL